MPRPNRKTCPKCGFYNFHINPTLQKRLLEEFLKYEIEGKGKTVAEMFNKIVSEYFFIKDTKAQIL